MIPAASAIVPPAVPATINRVEARIAEVEVVAVRIAGINGKAPVASIPVERTIEVGCIEIQPILPVKKDIFQIQITLRPICPIEVVVRVDTHEIVEVYLVCGLVLFLCEVQFVRHFVREEQSLPTCLLIAHGTG